MNSLSRYAAAFLVSVALACAALPVLHDGARLGAGLGVLAGALTGAIAMAMVAASAGQKVQKLIEAIAFGFLSRLFVMGAAMFGTHALHGDVLWCGATFFGLFIVGQWLEVRMVLSETRPQEHKA